MLMYCGNQFRNYTSHGNIPEDIDLVWNFKTEDFWLQRPQDVYLWRGSGWTGQVLVKNGLTYWSGLDSYYYCLDGITGKQIWRFKTGGIIKCTGVLYRDLIIVGSRDRHIRAINSTNGSLLWQNNFNNKDSSGLVADEIYYNTTEDGWLIALHPDTGELLWKEKLKGRAESSPCIAEGRIFVNSEGSSKKEGYLQCYSITNHQLLWVFDNDNDTVSSPVYFRGSLYYGTKAVNTKKRTRSMFCLNATNGTIRWQTRFPRGIWATPVVDNGNLLFGCDDGNFYCLSASDGKECWQFKTGSGIWATASLSGDKIIFGSVDGFLYCLKTNDGKLIWKIDTHDSIYSTPTIINDRIYIGTRSGYLFCFGKKREQ